MPGDTGDTDRERLSVRDKIFAVIVAAVLIAIIAAIFRLGIGLLHG